MLNKHDDSFLKMLEPMYHLVSTDTKKETSHMTIFAT